MARDAGTRMRETGGRVGAVLVRGIAAAVVLVMFLGLAVLVYYGRLDGGALLLYAGVILGYIIHASKAAI